jgi:hypothetical protein
LDLVEVSNLFVSLLVDNAAEHDQTLLGEYETGKDDGEEGEGEDDNGEELGETKDGVFDSF